MEADGCIYDYVEVYKGDQSLGKFCGESKPGGFSGITVKTGVFSTIFVTDPTVQENVIINLHF